MTNQEFLQQTNVLHNLLFSYALRLTRSRQDAEDLVQETTMKAFRHREKFAPGTNFKGWISTIMRNTFINQYRKQKTRQHINQPVEDLTRVIENKNVINNSGEQNLRMEELKLMMGSIRDIYTVPFLMYYQGYEYKEIADKLSVPIGTVKSRIFQARIKMKSMIRTRQAV